MQGGSVHHQQTIRSAIQFLQEFKVLANLDFKCTHRRSGACYTMPTEFKTKTRLSYEDCRLLACHSASNMRRLP